MSASEIKVINSVLKNGEINPLFESNVDELFLSNADIWDFIKEYYSKHREVPDVTIVKEKFPDLMDIDITGPTDYYLDELRSEYAKTKIANLIQTANQALSQRIPPQEIINKMMGRLYDVSHKAGESVDLNVMDFEDAKRHYEEVRRKVAERGGTPGIPTGVSFIDSSYTSGFAPGDLILVLGWTGRMKSFFTTLVACRAFELGYHPMIISLEMSEQKVRDRIYTIMGKGEFRNSELSMGEIDSDSFNSFANKFGNKNHFTVVANNGGANITPNLIQAKINQHKPDMVILDYAQLMSDNNGSANMVDAMRNLSKQLKILAVANEIPVILISSATPDNAKAAETPPTIEQVAWSKQLAFDADLAFAVHKHENSNHVEIVGRKNRNGELFNGILDWEVDTGVIKEKFEAEEDQGF